MKVDFNNLRRQAAYSYSALIDQLNNHRLQKPRTICEVDANGDERIRTGNILIDADSIQKAADELRNLIVALACCYEDNNEDCRSVIDEIKGDISVFNPKRD